MFNRFCKKITIPITIILIFCLFSTTVFAEGTVTTNLSEFKKEVVRRMTDRESSFSINYKGDTNEFISKSEDIIRDAYESDDYLQWSWASLSWKMTGFKNDIDVIFTATYHSTKEQEDLVEERTTKILSNIIKPDMTEKQKVKAIHDYVISHVAYDFSLQKRSAYAGLFEGKTVCQGYSLIMYKMLSKSGITSKIVTGDIESGPHAWNIVKIDGNWYHIDATNNAPNSDKYKFFNVTDSFLEQNGYAWEKAKFPKAVTKYSVVDSKPGTQIPKTETGTQTKPTKPTQPAQKPVENTVNNVIKAVETAEKSRSSTDIDKALIEIDKLSSPFEKSAFINRIQKVKLLIELNSSMQAVEKAEKFRTQSYVNQAEIELSKAKNCELKNELTKRLNIVKQDIALKEAEAKQKALESAKKSQQDKQVKVLRNVQKGINILNNKDIESTVMYFIFLKLIK